MSKITSPTLCALTVLALLTSVSSLMPRWTERLGLDFWMLPQYERDLAESEQRSVHLDAMIQGLLDRHTTKDHAVSELAAGRLTLFQTAARFRAANAKLAAVDEHFRRTYTEQ